MRRAPLAERPPLEADAQSSGVAPRGSVGQEPPAPAERRSTEEFQFHAVGESDQVSANGGCVAISSKRPERFTGVQVRPVARRCRRPNHAWTFSRALAHA